ncbi:hypothetical protein [Halanaerobium praevalens]|nr:hypothetical protein [Halanaerobium praevalens]
MIEWLVIGMNITDISIIIFMDMLEENCLKNVLVILRHLKNNKKQI